jgi:glycosyltransferase involved in cell wall biosynthesis
LQSRRAAATIARQRRRVSRPPQGGATRGERVRVVTMVDVLSTSGGAERLALLVATKLDPERFDSTLCVTRWPPTSAAISGPAAEKALELVERSGIGFLPLAHSRRAELAPWVRLGRFLRRERIEVLHAHKFGSNARGALIGRLTGVPVVLAHEHTWSYEGQPLRRFVDRELIARGADRFLAVSRADERRMTEVERIDPGRTLFVPNGIPDPPAPSGRDVRAELGIAPDAPLIGLVGVLRPQKAIDVMLHAVALLKGRRPDLRALLIGDGFERGELEAQARELGVGEHVLFLGLRADVPDLLAALDIAVSSSNFEGGSLAVMEYMAAAKPIVATAVGGTPDLIEDGVHGLLVPPRDPAAIAGAVERLLEDREGARAMGQRAARRRTEEFTIEAFVRRLEALYLELLASKRPARAL